MKRRKHPPQKLRRKLGKALLAGAMIVGGNEPISVRNAPMLPNDLIIRAATVSPNTLSTSNRTVSATIATDSAVPVYDPYTWEIIDEVLLAGGMAQIDRVNLLKDHDRSCVLSIQGDVHTFRINANSIDATLQFGRNLDDDSEAIYNRVEQGFLRNVSAGYSYARNDCVEIQPGQTATVDGRTFTAGARMLRVVRKWRLREVSLVVIPADELAQMRGQSATGQNLPHNSPSHLPTSATNNSQSTGTEPTAMHPLITFLRGLGLQQGASVEMTRAFALVMTDVQRAQATQIATQHGFPPEIPADLFRSTGSHGGQGSQGATNPLTTGGAGTPSSPSATIPDSNANPLLDGSGQRSGSNGNGQNNVTIPNGGSQSQPITQSVPSAADAIAAERSRAATIRDMAGPDISVELVTRALNDGWSIEQAAIQFVAARNAARPPALNAGGQAPFGHVVNNTVTLQTLQAGLLAREGVSPQSTHFATDGGEALLGRGANAQWLHAANQALSLRGNFTDDASRAIDAGRRMRNWSTREFARACCQLSNINPPEDDTELFERALSTQAWNALFTTNINAQLLNAYAEATENYQNFCMETEVDNFLSQDRVQAGKFTGMRKEGANSGDANLVNGGTPTTESFKIERFIGAMEYDDKAFVNNRFSSLEGMTIQEMGAMARRLPGDLVYGILLNNPNMADSSPLFSGSNALTTSPLNQANLQAAWKTMNTQQQDGVDLGVFPSFLITSASLKFTADGLLNSTYMVGGSSATPAKNTTEGLVTPIWDRRIDNGVLDHNSLIPSRIAGAPTTWFLAASAGRYTFEVAFLRGSGKAPRSINKPLDGRRIGRLYMIYLDVMAKALSRLGLLRALAS